jgi:hypothetical protein
MRIYMAATLYAECNALAVRGAVLRKNEGIYRSARGKIRELCVRIDQERAKANPTTLQNYILKYRNMYRL